MSRFGIWCVLLMAALDVSAQQLQTMTPQFGSFTGDVDVINLGTMNVHLAVPIFRKAGRGLPFNSNVQYDSSYWYVSYNSLLKKYSLQPSNSGWDTGTGSITGSVSYYIKDYNCGSYPGEDYEFTAFIDPQGVSHPFYPPVEVFDMFSSSSNCTPVPLSGSASAADNSGYLLSATTTSTSANITVKGPNGTIYSFPAFGSTSATVTDSNGNQVTRSLANNIYTFTDTLGVAALTNDTAQHVLAYTSASGSTEQVTLGYTSYTIKTNFQCASVADYGPTTQSLLTSIDLPDGTKYSFSYEGTSGFPGDTTGRISSISLPTGATISYSYSGANNGINCSDASPATVTRTTPDGTWTYSHTVAGAPGVVTGSATTITDPQGNDTVVSFSYDKGGYSGVLANYYETQRLVYQGSASTGTLLLTKYNCYNGNATNCATASVSGPITQRDAYIQPPSLSAAVSETVFNGNGLPTDQKEYDYGGTLVREAVTSYASLANHILDRPSEIAIKNGSGTTLSDTQYQYDQTTPASTSSPQHVAVSGTARGNPTTISELTSGSTYLNKIFTYFDTGLVQTSTDVNGLQASYTYGACGNSFPTTISAGGLSQSKTWDCTGGVLTSETDANTQTSQYHFTYTSNGQADPFWRMLETVDPLSNTTIYTYTPYTSTSSPARRESALVFNSNVSTTDVVTTLDSLGRVSLIQKRQAPGSSTFDTVAKAYDSVGRLASVSMPCSVALGTGCSTPKTMYTYDTLGRTTNVTDGGSGYTSYSYSSNDVLQTRGPAPSGENTKRKQMEYDGLGRLTSVCEITSGSGSGSCAQTTAKTGYWTKYLYDALSNLTGVTQNAQSTAQTRSFTYDGLSRLVSETNPESGTKTYTYDSIPVSPCNNVAQTFNGDLVRTADANGTYTCFFYDGFHRLTDVGTNRALDGCKRFRYDNSSGVLGAQPTGVHTNNSLGRLVEAETDTCAWPITSASIVTDEWSSYSARGELTDVWESTPHSGMYYHPTAAYWANGALQNLWISTLPSISYNVDGEGRTSTVSASTGQNPVTSTSYNLSSQVTGVALGSGDSDAFTYDPNTGRMTQYKYTVSGSAEVGNLTWNTNGSLKTLAITDPFNAGDAQTCNYTQDDLARISSVNCGTPWSQTFTYDPFGNVTKSGSISWQPGYSSSTNRYTLAGTSYDANGNLLKDSFHTYTVDVNGRPLTIDSIGLTYDALGRMVEQNQSGTYYEIVYDPLGRKLGIFSASTVQQFYVPLPGEAAAEYLSWGLSHYRHTDWLGSDRLETGASDHSIKDNNAYAPFGEPYAQIGNGEISFTGQNKDTTWLQYDFLARQYDPKQGRWIAPDPAGLDAADRVDPQTWNRYSYAVNSPLDTTDPLGLIRRSPCALQGTCLQPPSTFDVTSCSITIDGICTFAVDVAWHPALVRRPAKEKKGLFGCASEAASSVSIAGGLQALGIGKSGVGGFVTNALGGNAFSGATDLIQSFGSGEAGGHNVFYNMGQSVTGGPSQGFNPAIKMLTGKSLNEGPADVATDAILATAQRAAALASGSGETIQTLNGVARLGSVLGEAGEWATGIGEAKFIYDGVTYLGAAAGCGAGLIQ